MSQCSGPFDHASLLYQVTGGLSQKRGCQKRENSSPESHIVIRRTAVHILFAFDPQGMN